MQPTLRVVSDVQPQRAAARPYIEVKDVSQVFRRGGTTTHALDRIDLTVTEGEFVAIVGPSGCGKSTLLRIIAGLLRHTGGDVLLDGKEVTGAQTALGIVFQSPVLLEWRNVLDNVLLQLELRDLDPKAYLTRAHELLAKVGLGEFHARRPRELFEAREKVLTGIKPMVGLGNRIDNQRIDSQRFASLPKCAARAIG